MEFMARAGGCRAAWIWSRASPARRLRVMLWAWHACCCSRATRDVSACTVVLLCVKRRILPCSCVPTSALALHASWGESERRRIAMHREQVFGPSMLMSGEAALRLRSPCPPTRPAVRAHSCCAV
jgi:hypothetical protein